MQQDIWIVGTRGIGLISDMNMISKRKKLSYFLLSSFYFAYKPVKFFWSHLQQGSPGAREKYVW